MDLLAAVREGGSSPAMNYPLPYTYMGAYEIDAHITYKYVKDPSRYILLDVCT